MGNRMCRRMLVVVGLFVSCVASSAVGAEPDPELQGAKQAFIKEMKKKSPVARAAGVAAFAELPRTEIVDFLFKRGFTDDDPLVRRAVRQGLRKLAEDRVVGGYLFEELKKAFKKQPANDVTVELFRAQVYTADDERQAALMKLLDDYLASPRANLLVPMTVIDDLGHEDELDAGRIVTWLATAKAFGQTFGYRRCVVQSLSKIRQPVAIDFLLELLPQSKGLLQADVIEALTRFTRQTFRDHDRNWNTWWKENRSTFEFPPAGVALPAMAADDQQPTYYGMPICAKRVVFVLDTSGSMRGQPIESAKQALLKTIQSLPEAVAFDVITFDVEAIAWLPRLVPATKGAKQEAAQMIIDRGLKAGTVSNAALTLAFQLEPEAIYFLSDGEPTDGGASPIVNHITELNRTRRVSIHTIGVVTQRNGGIGLTLFMQPLAEQNYGAFRLVE
jgi:hypothetical protein